MKVDKEKGIQVDTSDSLLPPLSVLKGDIREAKELVLVSSPLDALVHYEEQVKKGNTTSLDKVCYMYVNERTGKELERPLESLVSLLPTREEIKVTLATSQETTKAIEPLLERYRTTYSSEKVTLMQPQVASYSSGRKLVGIALALISSSTAARMNTQGSYNEDETEEEKKKRAKARRMGYRL